MCRAEQPGNLDKVYSKLNEKFINEIIDLESER